MGLGQYISLGEYCGPHTASSVFLILLRRPSWRSAVNQGATQYKEECILHVQTNHRARKACRDMLQDLNQSVLPCPHCVAHRAYQSLKGTQHTAQWSYGSKMFKMN